MGLTAILLARHILLTMLASFPFYPSEGGAMRRRSFLKTVAAVAPAALQNFLVTMARAQASTAPPAVHVIAAGEDCAGDPHSLGFSSTLSSCSPRKPPVESSSWSTPISFREPLHLHLHQEEWFYVMEGEVAFQVGEQRVHLHAGESVLDPRLVPHTFSALGATPGRLLIAFCPAGKIEQYFQDAENANGAASNAEFVGRYEMKLVGPSPFWKS
jgi:mannose-6-phosphate isomerase-like protein (cupin superfamily)